MDPGGRVGPQMGKLFLRVYLGKAFLKSPSQEPLDQNNLKFT
jgi:hypothetical protein